MSDEKFHFPSPCSHTKQVKCKWDHETSCNRCTFRRIECIVTQRPKRQREKKKETYLAKVEERLQRMERAMAKSGLELNGDTLRRTSDEINHQGGIQDKLSMLKISSKGRTAFVGSSSGFSIFSPQGLRWITETTGNTEFETAINKITCIPEAVGGIFDHSMWYTLADHEREPLPPLDFAQVLIQNFFEGWNRTAPLYDKETFLARFAQKYPVTYSEDIGWYASLNVVFAIGWMLYVHQSNDHHHFFRKIDNVNEQKDQKWWKWFRNACSTFIDLQFREGTLLAVQAMIGMTVMLQALPDPFPPSIMIASALRVAQSIGLHRNLRDGFGLSPAEMEERCNVFWIAVVIERRIIHRSGRPSAIHEGDIGVHLPREEVPLQELASQPERFKTVRPMATLALLQGRIYNKLYSAKSLTKSKLERLRWVGILDEELQYWKESLPAEIRPGHNLKCHQKNILPVLAMQFGYFDALSTLHRVSLPYSSWGKEEFPAGSGADDLGLNPRVFASGAIRVGAARNVIDLLRVCDSLLDIERNVTRIFLDYYPLTASLVLFANILQNPHDPQALSDLELMRSVTTFLCDFLDDKAALESSIIIKTFLEVNNVAAQHVSAAREKAQQGSKRGRESAILTPSEAAKVADMRARVESVTPGTESPYGTTSPFSSNSTPHSATPTPQSLHLETLVASSSSMSQSPFIPNTSSQDHQNPVFQQQHSAHLYGNDPFPNLNLADMADPEDSVMLLDNCWFFPMTSPSINPNINSWPGMHLDDNGNVWDGSAFHNLDPLPVDSQARPNDEFMDMEYRNHGGEGTGYGNLGTTTSSGQ
ncbi:hypothetical protein BDZ45DRAFT_128055 [Acephala macrosclerotiorum]|nr:hypothetical protein BDZ45DRAFT_128055 [Acephala macrosclerotiorum]